MLFVTIQDEPAIGSILGQAFKGYKGCTWCMDETSGIWLKHCKKVVYMDHRRKFLMGQLRNVVPQRFTVGNTYLGWSMILKLFLKRGKDEEVKR
jgi:hypothetical protein